MYRISYRTVLTFVLIAFTLPDRILSSDCESFPVTSSPTNSEESLDSSPQMNFPGYQQYSLLSSFSNISPTKEAESFVLAKKTWVPASVSLSESIEASLLFSTNSTKNPEKAGKEIAKLIYETEDKDIYKMTSQFAFFSDKTSYVIKMSNEFWNSEDVDCVSVDEVSRKLSKISTYCADSEYFFKLINLNIEKDISSIEKTLWYTFVTKYKFIDEEPESYKKFISDLFKNRQFLNYELFLSASQTEISTQKFNRLFVKYMAITWIKKPINDGELTHFVSELKETDQGRMLDFLAPFLFKTLTM